MLCNRTTRGPTVNSKVREGFLKEAAFELTSEIMNENEPDPKEGRSFLGRGTGMLRSLFQETGSSQRTADLPSARAAKSKHQKILSSHPHVSIT